MYCTAATAEIAQIILEDSARIQEEDAAFKRRRHQRERRRGPHPEVPLYTVEQARAAIDQLEPIDYGRPVKLGRQVDAVFQNAGHILGSATVKIEFGSGVQRRSVVFSGDLGREAGSLLRDPLTYDQADYVVIESTYGNRSHPPQPDAAEQIARVINDTVDRGGNVLIPSFAVERAQDLLYALKTLLAEKRIPHLLFFVDSPMASDVTQVFEDFPELLDRELADMLTAGDSPFRFPGLTFVRATDDSKAINHIRGTVVIIAGSGMCTGGRIKHHLSNRISDPRSSVIFVGYQAGGTLGRSIVDGAPSVRILGQEHDVNAHIEVIDGLSAHAGREELHRWLDALKEPPRKVFVVHGEENAALDFVEQVNAKEQWDAVAPTYGEQFVLT